jgi:superfamily II DNA or RNA helicase
MASVPAPLVDAADILRLVGEASFERGRAYARGGAVTELSWDPRTNSIVGVVQGTRQKPYRCRIETQPTVGGRIRPVASSCSCPMDFDCKHVAATLLASNAAHVKDALPALSHPGAPGEPAWKTVLAAFGSVAAPAVDAGQPMALQFDLRARPRTGGPAFRLGVRPMLLNNRGHWVKANMSWTNIAYQAGRVNVDPEQLRWFSQFVALHRASGQLYFGFDSEWLYLDEATSPLLWHSFAEAGAAGIRFIGAAKDAEIAIAEHAELTLDARAVDDGLRVTPVLTIDGVRHPTDTAGSIGGHGVYAYRREPTTRVTLAPTSRPLTPQQQGLLGRALAIDVPAAEAPDFLDLYPVLRQGIPVTSSNGSVHFPRILPPVLVVAARFEPVHVLHLKVGWEYRHSESVTIKPLHQVAGEGGYRDADSEAETLARVRAIVPALEPSSVLQELDAAEFAEHVLPALQDIDGVRVDVTGVKPDYRELAGEPELTVTTVESDERDWFDLGVMVSIAGRSIPFDNIFRALAKGKSKLLLIDGSYLSLTQSVFQKLHRLIEEARALQEWDTGLRISKYQAGLWADLEELADHTEQSDRWRETVSGLLEAGSVEVPALPEGLAATLRHYQVEGFAWLAFLLRGGLGGILADDMGLGKTLQTLALLLHARLQSPNASPFLVVAPTSVVSNWFSEAQRFAPGLNVRVVSDTVAASGVPLDTTGVDVVVTSYTLFRLDFESYGGQDWAGLILDEAQFVKNRATAVHRCARDLKAPFKLAITGTPMENNLMELWALFAIVAPGLFGSAAKFAQEYQRPIERGEDSGERLARLRRRIRPLMLRRTKDVVATELPAKSEQVLEVELGPRHRKIYDTFLQRERQKLLGLIEDLDRNRFIVFRSLTLLRMLSLDASLVDDAYATVPSAKLDALFEQLDDAVAEGHRVLVFSQFTSFLKKAAARMDAMGIEYCYLDGSTRRRGAVIERFRSGGAPVFLVSLKAGGFGLNLTEADYVFLLDPWWNPATESQAVDRVHRIGQSKNVMVYRMVAAGTIEEKVMALKDRKAKLFNSVMDDGGAFSAALTAEDIRGLLEG